MITAEMSITDLEKQSGVARRTIHFYVREGLLVPPAKPGGGARYGVEHLVRLLRIRELQKDHYKLSAIRDRLDAELTGLSRVGMEELLRRLRSAPTSTQACGTAEDLQQYLEQQLSGSGASSSKQTPTSLVTQDGQAKSGQIPGDFSFAALSQPDTSDLAPQSENGVEAKVLPAHSPSPASLGGHLWMRFTARDGLEVQVREDILRRHGADILRWLSCCPGLNTSSREEPS